jgi:hypothetical protein
MDNFFCENSDIFWQNEESDSNFRSHSVQSEQVLNVATIHHLQAKDSV